MSKKCMVLLLCLITSFGFADEATQKLDISKKAYREAHYGTSIRNGIEALDFIFQQMMLTVDRYVPELKDFTVSATNYFYFFSSDLGNIDYYFRISKVMENSQSKVTVSFDNSLVEINRLHSLMISLEFMEDTKGYSVEVIESGYAKYNVLKDNDNAYILFIFEQEDDEIKSGFLVRVEIEHKKKFGPKTKLKLWRDYVLEVIEKIKTKTITYYLQ